MSRYGLIEYVVKQHPDDDVDEDDDTEIAELPENQVEQRVGHS